MTEERRNNAGWDEEGVERGSFRSFEEIVSVLRGEHGCPWDKAQTFDSLKICMVNEMTEALAAIDLYEKTGDAANLCEELGDVLLQVVLLSQIAKEEALFTVEDVIRGISRKMIRRHPHVFAAGEADGMRGGAPVIRAGGSSDAESTEPSGRWEAIKREEKKNRTEQQEKMEKEAFLEAADWVAEQLQSRK